MFPWRAQRERQSMHAALLGRTELGRQSGVDSAGPGDAGQPLKRGTDQQNAVVGLAALLGTGVAGVMGAVVLHPQHGRCEGLGQGCMQAICAGWVCHGGIIAPSGGHANSPDRVPARPGDCADRRLT